MNINKIKLSGTTYNIQDENATKTVELTQAQYDALSVKDPNTFYIITDATGGDLSNYYTKSETSGATQISTALAAKQTTLTAGTGISIVDNVISATGGGGGGSSYTAGDGIDITNDVISVTGKVDTTTYNTYTAATDTAIAGKQDTLVSGTNIKTINNESILGSGNITIEGGGGGKAIEAGRGISITTGETADTVSFNLPISAGTGINTLLFQSGTQLSGKAQRAVAFGQAQIKSSAHNSAAFGASYAEAQNAFAEGSYCHAAGNASHAEGLQTTAYTQASHTEGNFTEAKNNYEHASGQYNVSSSASTTFGNSGNTLFSVGNGTSASARHNAFEIRQNGDIYITKDGQDVKLQDQLGGGSITVDSALSSTSENPVQNKVIYQAIGDIETLLAAI